MSLMYGVKSGLNLPPKNLFRCEDIQRQLRLCGDGVNKEATVISYSMNILSYKLRGGTSVTVRPAYGKVSKIDKKCAYQYVYI